MFIISSKVKAKNDHGVEVPGIITHVDAKRVGGAPVIYHVLVNPAEKKVILAQEHELTLLIEKPPETIEEKVERLKQQAQNLLQEAALLDIPLTPKEKVVEVSPKSNPEPSSQTDSSVEKVAVEKVADEQPKKTQPKKTKEQPKKG